jgi:hypothetical protein
VSKFQYKRTAELGSVDIGLAADTDSKGFRHENVQDKPTAAKQKALPCYLQG